MAPLPIAAGGGRAYPSAAAGGTTNGGARMSNRYRKKPVVIEAKQFTGEKESSNDILAWIGTSGGTATRRQGVLVIPTIKGDMRANPGDWIIRGVQGEFYPCRDDIFAATYEPAE